VATHLRNRSYCYSSWADAAEMNLAPCPVIEHFNVFDDIGPG